MTRKERQIRIEYLLAECRNRYCLKTYGMTSKDYTLKTLNILVEKIYGDSLKNIIPDYSFYWRALTR